MDKNFIKVDDLVRQRLGGGEEKEREGAWLRMRELMDKEMPQAKPVGYLDWRRIMAAAGIVALLGGMGMAGYELSSYKRFGGSKDVAAVMNTSATTVASAQRSSSDAASNTAVPPAPLSGNDLGSGADITLSDASLSSTPGTANRTPGVQMFNDGKPAASDSRKGETDQELVANNKSIAAQTERTSSAAAQHTLTIPVDNTSSSTAIAGNTAPATVNATKTDEKQLLPVVSQPIDVSAPDGTHQPAVSTTAKAKNGHTAVAKNENQHTSAAKTDIGTLALNSRTTAGSTKNESTVIPAIVPLPSGNGSRQPAGAHKKAGNAGVQRTTTGSRTAAARAAALAKTTNIPATGNTAAEDGIAGKNADADNTAAGTPVKPKVLHPTKYVRPGKPAVTGRAVAGNMPKVPESNNGRPEPIGRNNTRTAIHSNEMSVGGTISGKRVISKMVIDQHYIKPGTRPGHYNLDTISIETLTEEPEQNKGSNAQPGSPAGRNSKKGAAVSNGTDPFDTEETAPDAVAGTHSAGTLGAAHTAETGTATGTVASQLLPGASAGASQSTLETKENATANTKKTGAAIVANLSAAFNEVKTRVKGVHFAPSLTAGINGTFFGPNSFKGFQFGGSGSFIFDETISIMGELKYFHRVNNNYAVNDEYYTYTPVAGGYSREHWQNSYTFSALHSIEMPISLRYHISKFNFFVGGNFLYSFSINTGAAPTLLSGVDPVIVNSVGNDTRAAFSDKDFNSRFGVGYLFGASYQIAPNVMLDLRNVQTVWDNAGSAGSRQISQQLYKSPSMQFSLFYRLGGNKHEE